MEIPPTKSLSRLVGAPLSEVGAIITDHVRLLRWKSALKIIQRAQKYADRKHIARSAIPLKFLVPFIEKASLISASAPEIDNWAALLVSARRRTDAKHINYIDILASLSKSELDYLHDLASKVDPKFFQGAGSWFHSHASNFLSLDGIQHMSDPLPRDFFRDSARSGTKIILAQSGGHLKEVPYSYPIFRNRKTRQFFDVVMVLERLGLVKIGSAWQKGTKRYGDDIIVWCTLTPLGFDFEKTCRKPSRVKGKK